MFARCYMMSMLPLRSTQPILGSVSFQTNHRLSLMSSEETCAFSQRADQLSRTTHARRSKTRAWRMEPDPLNCDRYRGGSGPSACKRGTLSQRYRQSPGGAQILVEDPSGNVVELFQPAS